MKIRSGFVTNSSSSSFTTIRIESMELAKHLQDSIYDEVLEALNINADSRKGTLEIKWEDVSTAVPDKINKFIPFLKEAFRDYIDLMGRYALNDDGEEFLEDIEEFFAGTKRQKELADSVRTVFWESFHTKWGEMALGLDKTFLLQTGDGREFLSYLAEEVFLGAEGTDTDEFYENTDKYIDMLTQKMIDDHISRSTYGTGAKYEFDRQRGIDHREAEFEFLY